MLRKRNTFEQQITSTILHTPRPYQNSLIIKKLKIQQAFRQPLRIAFLDIDATMTGDPKMTNKTRAILEGLGYAVVFVTTRTEELVMTEKAYTTSVKKYGFSRPRPHIGRKPNGKRTYLSPEIHEPLGILNPDIIAGSTGTQILVQQPDGGYMPDVQYEQAFETTPEEWRQDVLTVLSYLDPEEAFTTLSPLENKDNYGAGITDVFPPKYRIQIACGTLTNKRKILSAVKKAHKSDDTPRAIKQMLTTLRFTDDSHPEKDKYALYITPKKGYKAGAVERIVSNICEELQVSREDIELLIAGDSFPDLEMGLFGGKGTKTTFILVGGSRLTNVVVEDTEFEFAGEALHEVKEGLHAGNPGYYRFHAGVPAVRHLIVGDHAYMGKKAVESIFYFLQQHSTAITEPVSLH